MNLVYMHELASVPGSPLLSGETLGPRLNEPSYFKLLVCLSAPQQRQIVVPSCKHLEANHTHF